MSGFVKTGETYQIARDTRSKLDYGIKLRNWLTAGDSVAAAVWTVSDGLTLISSAIISDPVEGSIVMALVEGGGPLGTREWAEVIWTTTQGRREVQTLDLLMVVK